MPWVLEKLFLLEIGENNIYLGGPSKQMPFFQKKCAPLKRTCASNV